MGDKRNDGRSPVSQRALIRRLGAAAASAVNSGATAGPVEAASRSPGEPAATSLQRVGRPFPGLRPFAQPSPALTGALLITARPRGLLDAMHNLPAGERQHGAYRRWWRRVITVIGLVGAVVFFAAPALAHPVFSNDPPGFPNPDGGTGAANQTPPYAAGSRPTLKMFLPFEQEGVVFNGAENTTVDVQVTVPAGWISPACGAASTLAPAGYRQVGTVVAHWACAIETVSGHQVLHWTGPQVSPGQTNADSAQFFTFQLTVPSPAVVTSYGAVGGPEGFYVKQVYANGATSLWRTPNSTQPGEVANGIVRTVSNSSAPPPKPTGPPPPPEPEHGGPPLPGTTPTEAKPSRAEPSGPALPRATPAGSPLRQQQGGRGPAPAPSGQPAPAEPTTPADSPSAAGPGPSEPVSSQPPPGLESPPSSAVEQLTQQRNDAGLGWPVVAGAVLAVMLAAGVVIAVVKRRRRPS
jgi:hypothetical protein